MRVDTATEGDIPAWLDLAREVEFLFGPMVDSPGFHRALRKNILRGSAFCVREQDGEAGVPLMGGMLFSAKSTTCEIGWLSVAEGARRQGVGTMLVEHAIGLVEPPDELRVTTFAKDNPDGLPARKFYERFGFEPFKQVGATAGRSAREVFRLALPPTPRPPGR